MAKQRRAVAQKRVGGGRKGKSGDAAKDAARWIVTTDELAALFDLNERRIRQLAKEGRIPKAGRGRYDLREAVPAYIRQLRGALGVKPSDVPDLAEARARQAIADARVKELKAAEIEGRLVRREVVEEVFGQIATALRASLLTLPSKARGRIPHLNQADAEELERLIRDTLQNVPEEAGLPPVLHLTEEGETGDDGAEAGGN